MAAMASAGGTRGPRRGDPPCALRPAAAAAAMACWRGAGRVMGEWGTRCWTCGCACADRVGDGDRARSGAMWGDTRCVGEAGIGDGVAGPSITATPGGDRGARCGRGDGDRGDGDRDRGDRDRGERDRGDGEGRGMEPHSARSPSGSLSDPPLDDPVKSPSLCTNPSAIAPISASTSAAATPRTCTLLCSAATATAASSLAAAGATATAAASCSCGRFCACSWLAPAEGPGAWFCGAGPAPSAPGVGAAATPSPDD